MVWRGAYGHNEVKAVVSRNTGKLLIKSAFGEKETSNPNVAPISVLLCWETNRLITPPEIVTDL